MEKMKLSRTKTMLSQQFKIVTFRRYGTIREGGSPPVKRESQPTCVPQKGACSFAVPRVFRGCSLGCGVGCRPGFFFLSIRAVRTHGDRKVRIDRKKKPGLGHLRVAVQQAHRRGGGSPGEAEINVNSKVAGVAGGWCMHMGRVVCACAGMAWAVT